jgi:uncharacterized membrane protein
MPEYFRPLKALKRPAADPGSADLRSSNGNLRDLGTLGGNGSVAWAINNAGQVTGNALNDIPDDFNGFGDFGIVGATQTHAFLWQNGVMQDLGTLGGPDSGPFAINQQGQVVGMAATDWMVNPTTGLPTVDPFRSRPSGQRRFHLPASGRLFGSLNDLRIFVARSSTDSITCTPSARDRRPAPSLFLSSMSNYLCAVI